jgi:PAS domain S-box-containing protein
LPSRADIRLVPALRLIGRVVGDRRGVLAVSVVGLGVTLGAALVAHDPDTIGVSMLLPWVALFAFEAGPLLGLGAATVSFGLFLLIASAHDLPVTPTFVVGRFASFALIGIGVGVAGSRLRRSEQRSRTLVEGLPLVMYAEDESTLTYISPQIEQLLGYPVRDWLSGSNLWRRILHPADRERVVDGYTRAVAAKVDFECEYRLLRSDGRSVWVRDSSACIDAGKQTYRQGFIVDVTAQKKSEAEAARSATLMRSLVDRTVDGISFTDRDGRVVMANQPMITFVDELGIPREGLMHERLLGIKHLVVDQHRFESRMHELAASPDLDSADEFELRDSERVFQGYTKPVMTEDGTYLGRVWTLREVTEARQIDRIKDALVATVSHELRTPLTSIIGYLELLGTGSGSLSDEDARFVDIARRNAARLQRMVEELLFLSRVDAGGLSLDLEQVDVAQVARSAIGSAEPAAAAKELTLEFEGPGSAVAWVDEHRIAQVFDNLISNAIKFTPAGGRVQVSVHSDADAVVANVADSGYGIPEADQPRLFERFFRSSTTSDQPGTGLGLTVVRAIVEGHDGEITCRSVPGSGTTFTFSLPQGAPAPSLDDVEPAVAAR